MATPAEASLPKRIALRLVRVVVIGVVVLALLSLTQSVPKTLGLTNAKLAACPDSPNCVSSAAEDARHAIAPFALDRSLGATEEELKAAMAKLPRTKLCSQGGTYLHFECRSLIFRFVDDVEFQCDEASKLIHFRSASRVGHSDLGVNRRRMEAVRASLPKSMQYKQP